MADAIGRELKWDDPIENDGVDFTLLEPGEYPFRVIGFERKRFCGSAKLPPCNQAVLKLEVGDAEVSTEMESSLFLHTKTEGLLCAFFRSIGARKHGERVIMDWTRVVGATGWCKVGNREWTGKDGQVRKGNQVEKFLDAPDQPNAAVAKTIPGEIPF